MVFSRFWSSSIEVECSLGEEVVVVVSLGWVVSVLRRFSLELFVCSTFSRGYWFSSDGSTFSRE